MRATNPAAKFTIKRFESFRTHDGGGFNFDLYVDGKKVAEVAEEGHGGGLLVRWDDPKASVAMEEYVAALPSEKLPDEADTWLLEMYPTGFRTLDVETFLCKLADDYENAKRMKRLCSKKTLFRLPEDNEGQYRVISRKFDPVVKAHIYSKYPNATILNETL